jgi:aryl sulfotransferase
MRYRSIVADSARWDGFEFRPGDIVISTPPKSGTTWTQMLCALLIFDGPDFPAPLEQITFWVDMQNRSVADVHAAYAAQQHRRFMKTHTPLDGLQLSDDVTYIVVGRDPRDAMVSMEHHMANMNIDRFIELRAQAVGLDDLAELGPPPVAEPDPAVRFRDFVRATPEPGQGLTLASFLHHLDTAWQHRHQPNIAMFHYADYRTDLPGELIRMATALHIDLSPERACELAAEAGIERMRERADVVVPNASSGQWKDVKGFLRAGASGEWRDRCNDDDLAEYEARVAELVSPDLAAWAHLGRIASGVDPAAA